MLSSYSKDTHDKAAKRICLSGIVQVDGIMVSERFDELRADLWLHGCHGHLGQDFVRLLGLDRNAVDLVFDNTSECCPL